MVEPSWMECVKSRTRKCQEDLQERPLWVGDGFRKDVRTTERGRSWGSLKERSLNSFDLTCPHGKEYAAGKIAGKLL